MTTDGTYAFNGTNLLLQPSSAVWRERRVLGYDGYNIPIYEPTYSFQLSWDAVTPDVYAQLWDFWVAASAAGSVTVFIPRKGVSTYVFKSYSDCVLDEPTVKEYFAKHQMKVEQLIRNISV